MSRSDTDVRRAWLACLLLPLAFAAAFGIGEGLATLLGYPTGAGTPPPTTLLFATAPALLVFCIPAGVSAYFARRAAAHGDRRGWLPAGLLIAISVLFIALNAVSAMVG